MPQTSLSAWLSKSTGSPQVAHQKTPNHCVDSESGESIEQQAAKSASPTLKKFGDAFNIPPATEDSTMTIRLPPNVEIRACRKEDIPHFKRLNSLLLPIPYQESFYREVIEDPLTNSITLVAVWHDDPANFGKEKGRLVGAIRCRIFANPLYESANAPNRNPGTMLYLSTLVLLSPYRSHGVATRMLNVVTKRAIQEHGVQSIGAHVWEANVDGLEWYHKRGFRVVGKEDGYYRRLKPSGAVTVQREISVMDLVESS